MEYQKLQKNSEAQIAKQSIQDQNQLFDLKNMERERHLQKISKLNNSIETKKSTGYFNQIHTL